MLLTPIRLFDDMILDTFPSVQRLSERVEFHTNIPSLVLARLCVLIGSVVFFISGVRLLYDTSMMVFFMFGIQALLLVTFLFEAKGGGVWSSHNQALRNPRRINEVSMVVRAISIGYFLVAIVIAYQTPVFWWLVCGAGGVVSGLYFLACDQAPPSRRQRVKIPDRAVMQS